MAGSRPEAKAKRDKKKTALLIVIGDAGDDDEGQSQKCTRININTDVKGVFAVMPRIELNLEWMHCSFGT